MTRKNWFGMGLALTLAYACGVSKQHVSDGGGAGGNSAGESNTAGSPAGEPGVLTGGAGPAGAAGKAGKGGAAGVSGIGGAACVTPPVLETCEPFGTFYYDPETNECLHTPGFKCSRAPNAFTTLAECLSTCAGARPGAAACDSAKDCAVTSLGCCGLCPDAPIDGAQGMNRTRAAERAECAGILCGPCAPVDELKTKAQNYVPSCILGWCAVSDLSSSDLVAGCETDDDCHLRDGADCCEQCDGSGLIALSSEPKLQEVCSTSGSCQPCEHHDDGYRARCESGFCRVAAELGVAGASGTGG